MQPLEISASLVTFTVVSCPQPTLLMAEVGCPDIWPEPIVYRAIPSVNDERRVRLLETLATMERASGIGRDARFLRDKLARAEALIDKLKDELRNIDLRENEELEKLKGENWRLRRDNDAIRKALIMLNAPPLKAEGAFVPDKLRPEDPDPFGLPAQPHVPDVPRPTPRRTQRKPGLSPAGLAAAQRLMGRPLPEPGSCEPEERD